MPAIASTAGRKNARRWLLAGGLGFLGIASTLVAADPFSLLSYGAVGDGNANDTGAIQKAIDAAAAAGGGLVVVPGGRTFVCGTFELKSHVTLRLEPGSRLLASLNPADYTQGVLVHARGAEDIAIEGTGTIEGRGEAFMTSWVPQIYRHTNFRPKLVQMSNCQHVRMTQFILHDAPMFTVQLVNCDDVDIHGISILDNVEIPNNDGIDPVSSHNVRITDCTIQTGDDCVAVSSNAGPCTDITVSHCVLTTQDSALKIGSGTRNPVRNILFSDCVVYVALRGVDIMARDEGDVENVVARNITMHTHLFAEPWWGSSEAVYITAVPRTPATRMGHVRHVQISGITADGESGVFIRGTPDAPIEDVQIDGLKLEIAKSTSWPSRIDLRPTEGWYGPQEKDVTIAGFDLQDVKGIVIRNSEVRWGPNPPPQFGPLIKQVRVEGLRTENLLGTDAHAPGQAPTDPRPGRTSSGMPIDNTKPSPR